MVTIRDAATVMLVRDAPDLHVFMARRNAESIWIAGASVFPGGAIDPVATFRASGYRRRAAEARPAVARLGAGIV